MSFICILIIIFILIVAIYSNLPKKKEQREYDCNVNKSEKWGGFCVTKKNSTTGWNYILDSGLANEIGKIYKNKSIIDLGAGLGQYCKVISKYTTCHPYDGAKNIEIVTKGKVKFLNIADKINFDCLHDVVMSIEVGEHIPKEYEDIYIENLIKCSRNIVIITWARKEQGGFSHINEKDKNEVASLFESKGLKWDDSIHNKLFSKSKIPYIRNNLMVFSKL